MKFRERATMAEGETTILAIEDDDDIRDLILHHLRKDGHAVAGAADGEAGLRMAAECRPDLVILDLMLPGMDGMAVCRKLRRDPALRTVPILMLTARGEEGDIVAGLEAGADDYVTKPFSNRVLLARVRSLLRRSGDGGSKDGGGDDDGDAGGERLSAGGIVLTPERREVSVSGRKIDLTAGEFRMLHVLMRRPGIVFTRNQLLDLVRGALHAVTDRAVDVQVAGLRKKLGDAGSRVETVRGAGYRFSPE